MIDAMQPRTAPPKRGRPRRGTEMARTPALIDAATRVFLREGYGLASIDKVAAEAGVSDRKSTRLNSSHQIISYAVFCLKKKKIGELAIKHHVSHTLTDNHLRAATC